MKTYQLNFKQQIPVSLQQAWDFFSSPLNLAQITPTEMAFEVTSDLDPQQKMYTGMIITYKVSPLWGIKLNWVTEITHVEENNYFIDQQRFGPYRFWHHQHHFKAIETGVEMTDLLTYGLPMGFLGQSLNHLLIAGKLRDIFSYREKKITEIFGAYPLGK